MTEPHDEVVLALIELVSTAIERNMDGAGERLSELVGEHGAEDVMLSMLSVMGSLVLFAGHVAGIPKDEAARRFAIMMMQSMD